ncbi:hypothetical protein F0267_25940 [Vibrio coralliilyticus]|uniref:hypothetical protein n=1 Tax=Vibrio TaxID=662 RepID=UPI00148CC59A|nr:MULTISPECIES: hypothetical protein [Vibrio]NOH26211.1 hypothetical protein [Vibrio europaeus]NOH41671.1 hypothetical protein [Vibrio coralliilyticus]
MQLLSGRKPPFYDMARIMVAVQNPRQKLNTAQRSVFRKISQLIDPMVSRIVNFARIQTRRLCPTDKLQKLQKYLKQKPIKKPRINGAFGRSNGNFKVTYQRGRLDGARLALFQNQPVDLICHTALWALRRFCLGDNLNTFRFIFQVYYSLLS